MQGAGVSEKVLVGATETESIVVATADGPAWLEEYTELADRSASGPGATAQALNPGLVVWGSWRCIRAPRLRMGTIRPRS